MTCDLFEIRHLICWGGKVANVENNNDEYKSWMCRTTNNNNDEDKKNDSSYFGKKQNEFRDVAFVSVSRVFVHRRPLMFGVGTVLRDPPEPRPHAPPPPKQNRCCRGLSFPASPRAKIYGFPESFESLRSSLWLPRLVSSRVSKYDVTALCKLNGTHPNQSNSWPFSQ